MQQKKKLTTREVTQRIIPVFREAGYDGASLEALAAAAGLTRGTLYHHFPKGKAQMADAVLTRAGTALTQHILTPLRSGGDTVTIINSMLDGVLKYYGGDPPVCLMNALTLGEGRVLFGAKVEAAVNAWHKMIVDVLVRGGISKKEANCEAIDLLASIQGALILSRVAGSRRVFEDAIGRLQQRPR